LQRRSGFSRQLKPTKEGGLKAALVSDNLSPDHPVCRIMYIMKEKELDWFKDKAKNLAQCWY